VEIHVDLQIAQQQKTNPSITTDDIHKVLTKLYSSLLDNPAVSGLAIGVDWSRLNPNPPSNPQPYDWSYLDDAFASISTWNTGHPSQVPKTIQVQVSAGFGTPSWVLDQIPSCDGLFQSPPQTPAGKCGKATFIGFVEGGGGVLPMPWDAFYKESFKTFLTALADRYGANPSLVSMDVSGPTAASTEMILPNDVNTPDQSQFGGLAPNEMWSRLLAHAFPTRPEYQKSDQAFIDEWDNAIDLFGETFHELTLMIWTGDGLINFNSASFPIPNAFQADCPTPSMDCAAETTILSHFIDPAVDPADAKATGEAGMHASAKGAGNLDVTAARQLAASTAGFTQPSAQILAGEQFATSAALFAVQEGCTSRFPPDKKGGSVIGPDPAALPVADIPLACLAPGVKPSDLAGYAQFQDVPAADLISPDQAIYNVLQVFFNGTPEAAPFGGTPGTGRYNFLQIYSQDIKYATDHAQMPATILRSDGTTVKMSAQDVLNLASQKLLEMNEPQPGP
jgi:hypothetical protein